MSEDRTMFKDGVSLNRGPPYMEIKSRAGDIKKAVDTPSASLAPGHDKDNGVWFCLILGTEYEKKKQKLQQELQLDYKKYVAQQKDLKTNKHQLQPQGLSLPIDERNSVKEKLREERNKEYNIFLKEQHQTRRLKWGSPPITHKPGEVQDVDALHISSPSSPLPLLGTQPNIHPTHRELPESRKDAATLPEAARAGKSRGTWHRGHHRQRNLDLHQHTEPLSSEEELHADKEEGWEFSDGRKDRHSQEPEYRGERRTREDRDNRAPRDIKEVKPPGVLDQNSSNPVWNSNMRDAARTRSANNKDKAEFCTGLMIGAVEDNVASQKRKEQYKEDLLKQIAEQQRKKMKERELERGVAATGAIDPEEKPNILGQFVAVNRRHDSWRQDAPYKPGRGVAASGNNPNPRRPTDDKPTEGADEGGPPRRSQVAFLSPTVDFSTAASQLPGRTGPGTGTGTAPGFPSPALTNEDYHRNLSNTLGEMAVPRFAGVPPPAPPAVSNTCKTPYDAAYYYYGARHPLDPNLLYDQNGLPEAARQPVIFQNPPPGEPSPLLPPPPLPPPPRPNNHTEATGQHGASQLPMGMVGEDRSKQTRERALSHQEALRQQMKEREEHKRKEREESERYDAKLRAEMMVYNPWGRGGGGAPIKDKGGNLISDLNKMHRSNEEVYRNPRSRDVTLAQNFVVRNCPTPGAEVRAPSRQQVPVIAGFSDQPTPQQHHKQDSYKDDLRQQIEENKRKQAAERERIRQEDEREERRLAEQRARMQQEYEEEVRRVEKKSKQSLGNERLNSKSDARCQEEKRRTEEQKIQVPENHGRREERQEQRRPSPSHLVSRPSTVSQLSSRTMSESSVSAPPSPPVPAKRNQIRAKDDQQQQEVHLERSALRRHPQKKKSEQEDRLSRGNPDETHSPLPRRQRRRPRVDPSDSPKTPVVQTSARRPFSFVTTQNIREFNQLKYRDTASREEVLHMYPDPPKDAQSLDIQQQALLRQQHRANRHVKRGEEGGSSFQPPSRDYPRTKPPLDSRRDSMLPFETTFLDVYGCDSPEELVPKQRSPQPSAKDQDSPIPQRSDGHDEVVIPNDQSESLQSASSLSMEAELRPHNQHRITPDQDRRDHNCRSEGPSGDDVSVLSLRSSHPALERRVSVETVATEAWLRPGTSDAVKRRGCKEGRSSGMDRPPWPAPGVVQLPLAGNEHKQLW